MLSPIRDLVYIKPIFESDTWATESNVTIYKVDQSKSRSTTGVVVDVGPRVKEIKPGDKVFYPAYDGQLWAYKGTICIIMQEKSIVAKWDVTRSFTVPGLYMRDKEGFFAAPYDGVVEFLTRALEKEDSVQAIKVKSSDPTLYKDEGPEIYDEEGT